MPEAPTQQIEKVEDHWLYRCYDASGELLYVGITSAGFKRFRRHGNDKAWWPFVETIKLEHFESAVAARRNEVVVIRREQPRFNKLDNAAAVDREVVRMYRRCSKCGRHYRPADPPHLCEEED